MAATTVAEQVELGLVVQRVAGEPLRIGELQRELEDVGRTQLEIQSCRSGGRNVNRRRGHDVARRADGDLVAAGLQPAVREAVAAVGAADDSGRDGAAG